MNAQEIPVTRSFGSSKNPSSKGFLAAGGIKPSLVNIIFAVLTILIAVGLKHHYSQASVEDLSWILAPTVELVEQLGGITFEKEAYTGFISKTHRIIIAKSCAGVNFFIIAFCMLIFSRIPSTKPVGAKILLFIKITITVYILTIIVNAFRIILGIYLFNANIYGGWLTREMVHRIEGTAIYFIFLCILYYAQMPRQFNENKPAAPRAIKSFCRRSRGAVFLKRGRRPRPIIASEVVLSRVIKKKLVFFARIFKVFLKSAPLVWYLLVTFFIPLIRRSYKGELSGFFRHSLIVIVVLVIILLFFSLLRWILGHLPKSSTTARGALFRKNCPP